jgi:hypothetical protein
MSDLMKTMRLLLFRLWNRHADEVAKEGRRLAETKAVERAYAAGFRDGFFGAVSDLVQEGVIEGLPKECVAVTLPPVEASLHH